MKRVVGMACQKVHKQFKEYAKAPSLHLYSFVKRCWDGWDFVYLPSLLSFLVCVLLAHHSYISFHLIFLSCTLIVENKERCGVRSVKRHSCHVDVSHHSFLQVHLGLTGEEQLYNVCMTTVTGAHEGSPAILRNTMRQNSTVTVMNMERQWPTCMIRSRDTAGGQPPWNCHRKFVESADSVVQRQL